ncbi:hypothetical protein MNEG_5066 [Monoraphidium neglectum]|uniref:BZIP domain-containing protein n=1 Tax=Monoraphidium neglectum TaxID=145388 RepID=A0A0D2MIM5_9CHLO|nr:hypothetical protein MNEG_5066 [Monoraphidium neglectum]KIZ02890.1 hypothetical protein MNEG_5066 [Monoraphidium neglectum]|eukprot:XP_013901909.1 hypothetical protein MNEG_5066 [Monoraphidium neglectum]
MAGGALAGMAALDALTGGHAALAELNAQAALLAGLPSNLQQMVPPIAPLQGIQTESQTIDALQQAILATINTSGSGMPNLFAALHTLGAEQGAPAPPQPSAPPPQPQSQLEEETSEQGGASGSRKARRRASDVEEEDDGNRTLANTREKNRLAQRRFREKQKATISEQKDKLDHMARQLDDYKREVQLLREENNILRAKLEGRATLHQHMITDPPMG